MIGLPQKSNIFFWLGINKLPERWEKCVASDEQYFELDIFSHFQTDV